MRHRSRRCSTTPPARSARSKHIQERHVANCSKADPAYGRGVVDALVEFADGEL
jgi:catalase